MVISPVRSRYLRHFDATWIAFLIVIVGVVVGMPVASIRGELIETAYDSNFHHYDLGTTGFLPGNRPVTMLPAAMGYSTPLQSLSQAAFPYVVWATLPSEDARFASCYLFDEGSELRDAFLNRRGEGWPRPYYDHGRLAFLCGVLWRDVSEPVVDEIFRRDQRFLGYCLLIAVLVTVVLIFLPRKSAEPAVPVAGAEAALQASMFVLKVVLVGGSIYFAAIGWSLPTGAVITSTGAGGFLAMAQSIVQLRTILTLALASLGIVHLARFIRCKIALGGRQSASLTA